MSSFKKAIGTLLVTGVLVTGCAEKSETPPAPTPESKPAGQKATEATGDEKHTKASFYGAKGDGFKGKETASGEKLNPGAMTAAHKSLPLGTEVEVTNPKNGKSVRVRINDRGPFVKGRGLDLSHAAASALGVTGKGVESVTYKVVKEAK